MTMVSNERQTIMETNRSLRTIKNELETLLEKGIIDESVFDTINNALPAEAPLHGPLRTASSNHSTPAPAAAAAAAPARSPAPAAAAPSPAPPTQALQNLNIHKAHSPAPPSYDQTPPPGLPARSAKPVVAYARALYRYNASDARDLTLEKDDKVAVHEYMNQDWWMGQNQRTGREGIFPRNYVLVEQENKAPLPPGGQPQYAAQPQYGYPGAAAAHGPPAQQNPYNAHVPPMAVADGGQPAQQQQGEQADGKMGQYGKKFGKKLGNAAIFGAGATIGGNIVNSIF